MAYKAAGYEELLEKLRKREKELFRRLVEPEEEPVLKFPLLKYLPTEEHVGKDDCMAEMPQWVQFWRNPPEKHGRSLWLAETQNKRLPFMGRQTGIPVRVIIETPGAAVSLLGLEGKAKEFLAQHAEVERELPEAAFWFREHYFQIPSREDAEKLIRIGRYFLRGVEEDKFLREIHVQGVDTKYLERHGRLLSSLWTALRPEYPAKNMEELRSIWKVQHAERANIALRVLDEALSWHGVEQFFLTADELAKLRLPVKRVFITENKTNGFRFPRMKDSLVLFGMGYGVLELADKAAWLKAAEVIYWGDLDDNGFDILSKLRGKLPQVRSMLMDEPRLVQEMEDCLVEDDGTRPSALPHLTVMEKMVWKRLHDMGKRFEQEKLPPDRIEAWVREKGFLQVE